MVQGIGEFLALYKIIWISIWFGVHWNTPYLRCTGNSQTFRGETNFILYNQFVIKHFLFTYISSLIFKTSIFPSSARVRRSSWNEAPQSTYPWTLPIQSAHQAPSYHPSHIHTKSSSLYREQHSSKAQPSVIVSGSAPGFSISEGTIRSMRLLRLLTTAVELTSYRHPTSTQRTSTLPEETQNSLHATVHVMPLRIDVNSVISTTTTTTSTSHSCHHHISTGRHSIILTLRSEFIVVIQHLN